MKTLKRLLTILALTLISGLLISCQPQVKTGWDLLPEILEQIKEPVFQDKDFNITEFGAVGDGKTDCSDAISKAITECNAAGGGRVVVPAGNYLTGPVHLKSNVNLHLEENATLLFSPDIEKYLPVVHSRWEGVEVMNYSPFVYAFEQENIAITGKGTLNGQANNENWWPMCGAPHYGWTDGIHSQRETRSTLFQWAEDNVPVVERVFPNGSYLRPQFVQPYRCKNVLIEGITIVNSPMWELHPVLCENVIVRGVHINSHGPNNDGCDPESCKNVLIEDCFFNTGDDCIALKSGRNADGRRVNTPCENIIIRNCTMKDGHGGVVIGSEITGGAINIFAENCEMDSPNLERALRIKTNSLRGGNVENIYFRNVRVGQVSDAVVRVNFYYENGDAGEFTPSVKNIQVSDVTCEKSNFGLLLMGYPNSPVTDITLNNCTFNNAANGNRFINVKRINASNTTINGKEFTGVEENMVPDAVLQTLKEQINTIQVARAFEEVSDDGSIYIFATRDEMDWNIIKIHKSGKFLESGKPDSQISPF